MCHWTQYLRRFLVFGLVGLLAACGGGGKKDQQEEFELTIVKIQPVQGPVGSEVLLDVQGFAAEADEIFFGDKPAALVSTEPQALIPVAAPTEIAPKVKTEGEAEKAEAEETTEEAPPTEQIKVTVPEGLAGAVMIQIKGPERKSNTKAFTVTAGVVAGGPGAPGTPGAPGAPGEPGTPGTGLGEGGEAPPPPPLDFSTSTFSGNPAILWLSDESEAVRDVTLTWSVGPDNPTKVLLKKGAANTLVAQYEGATAKSGSRVVQVMGNESFRLEIYDGATMAKSLQRDVQLVQATSVHPFSVSVDPLNHDLAPWTDYQPGQSTITYSFGPNHPYTKICIGHPAGATVEGPTAARGPEASKLFRLAQILGIRSAHAVLPSDLQGLGADTIQRDYIQLKDLDIGRALGGYDRFFSFNGSGEDQVGPDEIPTVTPGFNCYDLPAGVAASGTVTFTPTANTRVRYYAVLEDENSVEAQVGQSFYDISLTPYVATADLTVERATEDDVIYAGRTNIFKVDLSAEYADKVLFVGPEPVFPKNYVDATSHAERAAMKPLAYIAVNYNPDIDGYNFTENAEVNESLNAFFAGFTQPLYKMEGHYPAGGNPHAARSRRHSGSEPLLALNLEDLIGGQDLALDRLDVSEAQFFQGYELQLGNNSLALDDWGNITHDNDHEAKALYIPINYAFSECYDCKFAFAAIGQDGSYHIAKKEGSMPALNMNELPAANDDSIWSREKGYIWDKTIYNARSVSVSFIGNSCQNPTGAQNGQPLNDSELGTATYGTHELKNQGVPTGNWSVTKVCRYQGMNPEIRLTATSYLGQTQTRTWDYDIADLNVDLRCANGTCTLPCAECTYGKKIVLAAEVTGYQSGKPFPYKELEITPKGGEQGDCETDDNTKSVTYNNRTATVTYQNWGLDCYRFKVKAKRLDNTWTGEKDDKKHRPALEFTWSQSTQDQSPGGYTGYECYNYYEGWTSSCDVERMEIAYRGRGAWTKNISCSCEGRDDDSSNRGLSIEGTLRDVFNEQSWGGETGRLFKVIWDDESDWVEIDCTCTAYGADGQSQPRSFSWSCSDSSGC